MIGQDALWSAQEVKVQAAQCAGQVDIWEATALSYCPCCEGSGQVPSASGWSDVPCLCAELTPNDRVILHGRADTLAAWERGGENGQYVEHLRSTMIHLVAGCSGPCRGNAGEVRCVL